MSTNRKPAFRWIGIEGVHKTLAEIKLVIKQCKPDAGQGLNLAVQSLKFKK